MLSSFDQLSDGRIREHVPKPGYLSGDNELEKSLKSASSVVTLTSASMYELLVKQLRIGLASHFKRSLGFEPQTISSVHTIDVGWMQNKFLLKTL